MDTLQFVSLLSILASLSTTVIYWAHAYKKSTKQCTVDPALNKYTPLLCKIHNALLPEQKHVTFTLDDKKIIVNNVIHMESVLYDIHFIEKSQVYDNVWANLSKCVFLNKEDDAGGHIKHIGQAMHDECGIEDIYRYLHLNQNETHDAYVYINRDNGNVTISKMNRGPWSKIVITPRNECFTYKLVSFYVGNAHDEITEISAFLR